MGATARSSNKTATWRPLALLVVVALAAFVAFGLVRRNETPQRVDLDSVDLGSTVAVPNPSPWSVERSEALRANVAQNPDASVVFVGDSITQLWENEGADLWSQHLAGQSVNLGVAGDRTQHVLYRLKNGELEGLDPEVAIVQIGTNNASAHSAEEIVDGIAAIIDELRTQLPEARIIVYTLFPRTDNDDSYKVTEATRPLIISDLESSSVTVVDASDFRTASGAPRPELLLDDGLHLSPLGYEVWLQSILENL